jgi:hypothetical protein
MPLEVSTWVKEWDMEAEAVNGDEDEGGVMRHA